MENVISAEKWQMSSAKKILALMTQIVGTVQSAKRKKKNGLWPGVCNVQHGFTMNVSAWTRTMKMMILYALTAMIDKQVLSY